jgi:hypothetical protein
MRMIILVFKILTAFVPCKNATDKSVHGAVWTAKFLVADPDD